MTNSGRVLDLTHKPIGAKSPYLHKFGATKIVEFFAEKISNYMELLEVVPGVRLELTRPILSNPRILSPNTKIYNQLKLIDKIKIAYRQWSSFGFYKKVLTRHLAPHLGRLQTKTNLFFNQDYAWTSLK